jgi:hypothetical protein
MPGPETDPTTNPANVEERLQLLEERLRDLQDKYDRRPRAMFERMVPPEVRAHLRASQRERLLALRAWLDVAIKRTEESPERPRRPESVRIQ